MDGSGKLGQINYDGVFTSKAEAMVSNDHYKITTENEKSEFIPF